jgi:Flp pilus assembly protein protease CpaA
MKRTISPLLGIGLLLFAVYTITDRFVTPISNWLAIPLLVIAIVLIMVGGLKSKEKNKKTPEN